MTSSPPKKKKSTGKNPAPVANNGGICNYKYSNKCQDPVAIDALDPTKCVAHQMCSKCNKRIVGSKPARQREGICPHCVKDVKADEKQESRKQFVKTLQIPEGQRPMWSMMKDAMNATNTTSAINTPSNQGTDAVNSSTDAMQHMVLAAMEPAERFTVVSSKESNKNKATRWLDLTGCTVFVTDGNKEDEFGTERIIIKTNVTEIDGNSLVQADGISGTLHSGQYVVLRNKEGKAVEEKFFRKISRVTKKLTFVDSFEDADTVEGTKKVYLSFAGVPYYVMNDGEVEVKSCSTWTKKFNLGTFPKSEADAAMEAVKNWFESDEFDDWAKDYATKHPGVIVSMDVIHDEMARRGVSLLY